MVRHGEITNQDYEKPMAVVGVYKFPRVTKLKSILVLFSETFKKEDSVFHRFLLSRFLFSISVPATSQVQNEPIVTEAVQMGASSIIII